MHRLSLQPLRSCLEAPLLSRKQPLFLLWAAACHSAADIVTARWPGTPACCAAAAPLSHSVHPIPGYAELEPCLSCAKRACVALAQGACNWLMQRLNRRSVVIIAMTLLMGLSVLIILYEVSALQVPTHLAKCLPCTQAVRVARLVLLRQAVPVSATAGIRPIKLCGVLPECPCFSTGSPMPRTNDMQFVNRHSKRAFPQAILATVDAAWEHRLWHFGKICA